MGEIADETGKGTVHIPANLNHLSALVSKWFGPDQLGSKGYTRIITSENSGCKLATYHWPAATTEPKAVIVAVHGHGAYTFFEYLTSMLLGGCSRCKHIEGKHIADTLATTYFNLTCHNGFSVKTASPCTLRNECLGTGPGMPQSYAGSWIEALNEAGYTVCAMDFQGHGLSEGRMNLRCYFESFDDLADDMKTFVGQLRTDPALHDKPFFLLGESMGGGVSTYITLQQPGLFKGTILLAPMLSLEKISRKGLNPYLRSIGSFLSWLCPTAQLVATEKSPLQDGVQRRFDEDPFTYHDPTRIRLAQTYLEVTEYMGRNAHKIQAPLLIFHSELDTMCDADGSKRLYLQAQSKDKTLRLCNDMWHALVKENHNEDILQEIIAWIKQRL